ncbi:PLP-dependent aminotransferase family protein [Clostridiisalibacter paucivorans]|uniref:MocR-like pyridoxine biosynthesis transcription factor PdxR n=1 Tax=Clostridiisalibacter paucivorans TaxID=408753 RepID=UPI00047B478A|nr:PLP-dependent aminotransferase family protein [Clostridiisalibacter paucivorans]
MNSIYDISLDRSSNQHLYIQLYNEIKKLIVDKELNPHHKLPPIRKLSEFLNVNNVTVVNAYKLLEQENFVYKKIGSGTFVNKIIPNSMMDMESNQDIKKNNEDIIDFASATPTPDLFPVSDFKLVMNEVLDRDKGDAFGYQESQGYLPLRKSIMEYISNYNIHTRLENIHIVSGAQQGIDIISKSLIDYGDIVFIESPTYTGAIGTFKSRAARIIEIPMLEDGIDIQTLENKLKTFKPKFIYVMPNFQNPTGFSYSLEKKQQLLKLANEYDIYIVEDDYLSDLSFYSNENTTLKSMDKNDKVIYIKSFSKIFMPGLRLAFVVIPISLTREFIAAKHISDISTSSLIQRAFDLYLKKGIWQKHINYMENIYKKRFEIMSEGLKKYMPKALNLYNPMGGLNFWISLPHGFSADVLYEISIHENITFVPGSYFFLNKRDDNHFRLSIASVYADEIYKGIEKMSTVIKKYLSEQIYVRDEQTPLL